MRSILLTAAVLVAAFLTTGCVGDLAARAMGPDPVQQHIETMENTALVPYFVNFHKDPKVGQYAVYTTAMGEEWYGLVGGEKGAWLVEKRAKQPGQDFTLAILMEVDNDGSVKQAWAAEYDPEAEEKPVGTAVKVMDKPEPVEASGEAAEGPKPTWSKEKVGDLQTDKMTLDKSEMWYSKKAYFSWMLATDKPLDKGGVVKMAYDGNVSSELVEQGTKDLEPSMNLEAAAE